MTYEITRLSGTADRDACGAPFVPAKRAARAIDAPNGAARMAYALARLRASDEARSEELTRDARCYEPDPDETTHRPCGAARDTK